MSTTSALVLFAHGARDPRWAAPFQRLQQLTQDSLANAETEVRLAFLEFMQPSLPDLFAELDGRGIHTVSLVPVFLGQGGHVLRDLPVIVEQLKVAYPQLQLKVVEAAGEDLSVLLALRDYCVKSL